MYESANGRSEIRFDTRNSSVRESKVQQWIADNTALRLFYNYIIKKEKTTEKEIIGFPGYTITDEGKVIAYKFKVPMIISIVVSQVW